MKKNTLLTILIALGFICVILVIMLFFKQRAINNGNKNVSAQETTAEQISPSQEDGAVPIDEPTENQAIEVDESLFDVTVTLPSTFFEDTTEDEIKNSATEKGIKEVTINEDGSITYVMSKAKHNEFMEVLEAGILEYFEELKGEEYPSIIDVEYNNGFTKVTLIVDRESYEGSFDFFAVFGVGLQGMYYQKFDSKEMHTEVSVKDNATGEVFSTTVYPDAME